MKNNNNTTDLARQEKQNKLRNLVFYLIIAGFSWVLYGNTVYNYYNFDDYRVIENNVQAQKGLSAIPEIFSTPYADESGLKFGYRPIVRVSFALDYELFGNIELNGKNALPYVCHAMNVFYFMIALLILFTVLRRIFRNFNPFFPFLIVIIYMAHPLHTEIVASLKSRDEILNLIFCSLALLQFIKWANREKMLNLVWGVLFFILAILSKLTAFSFILIFPLTLYFFTEIRKKRLINFSIVVAIIAVLAAAIPIILVSDFNRTIWFMENPLVNEGFFTKVATGFYVLLLYLKKLVFPEPLLFYYGYNMIPVKSLANGSVILSLLIYIGMFAVAIWRFKEKHLISYIILFFLITIAMFSNILMPVPGIMGDRFMFFPALAFSMFVVWLLFWLFRLGLREKNIKTMRLVPVLIVTLVVIVPFTSITTERNKDWRTKIDLYENDIKDLDNSVKAHDMYATEIIRQVTAVVQSEPINVVKFQMPAIRKAIKHYNRAIDIYPKHYSSYYNLGFIYSEFLNEYTRAIEYFNKSIADDAIKEEPFYPRAFYYMGRTYERMGKTDSAISYYKKAFELNPRDIRSMAARVNVLLKSEKDSLGIELAREMRETFPDSELADVHMGVYHLENQDTAMAINFFRRALMKGNFPSINVILYNYYRNENDWIKANFFYTQAREEMKRMQSQQQKSNR